VVIRYNASTLFIPPDTLKPAGAVEGSIQLPEGGDPRKVFIFVFDVDIYTQAQSDGSFKISNLAEGKYHLRCIPTLDNYGALDTGNIYVFSGDTTNIGPLKLPFSGIPTPNVWGEYNKAPYQ
jgi:hypothetical protein